MSEWTVVSFYTKDTGYEKEIKKLEASLLRFGIEYHFFAYPSLGKWRRNLNYKSDCIAKAFDLFPGKDIVFLDADAVVQKHPALFDALSEGDKYDIAVFYHAASGLERNELVANTMWYQNNGMSRRVVQRWHQKALEHPELRHQKCLDIATREMIAAGEPLRIYALPFEYALIYDHPNARGRDAVIKQFQVSRKLKRGLQGKRGASRVTYHV